MNVWEPAALYKFYYDQETDLLSQLDSAHRDFLQAKKNWEETQKEVGENLKRVQGSMRAVRSRSLKEDKTEDMNKEAVWNLV